MNERKKYVGLKRLKKLDYLYKIRAVVVVGREEMGDII